MSSSNNKIDISKDGYNSLLNKVLTNLQEERDLALDRYRIQDEQMVSPEDFVLQGKDVVAYLKLASERTNTLLTIAKELKELVFSNELNGKGDDKVGGSTFDPNNRKAMEQFVKEMKENKENKKNLDDIKDDDVKPE